MYSESMIKPTLDTMKEVGYHQAIVFHGLSASGSKGMDEMSTLGPTKVMELRKDGSILTYTVNARDLGIKPGIEKELLTTGDREQEAIHIMRLLSGEENGPRQDIVCLNTAPILYMMGKASSLEEGVERARSILASGAAIKKLQEWTRVQNSDPSLGEGRFNDLAARADIPA